MLRSLLIGFLILSALTSKGAEAQILKNDLNISADILLEFFNSVTVQNTKAAELSAAKIDGSTFMHTSFSKREVQSLFGRLRQISPIAWMEKCNQTDHDLKGETVFLRPVSSDEYKAFFCESGLSPPIVDA